MSLTKVETNAPKTDRSLEVEYDFGDTVAEAMAKFGESVVFSNYKQNVVIALQSLVRRELEKKEDKRVSDDSIITKVAAWIPGVAAIRTGDKKQKALEVFMSLSTEEKLEFIKKLRESAGE
jgi:hypothetical protein